MYTNNMKIQVPEGMLKAAFESSVYWNSIGKHPAYELEIRNSLEAGLRWLSENPIVPTTEQVDRTARDIGWEVGCFVENYKMIFQAWQRRMFLAEEKNPVVQRIKNDLTGCTLTSGDAVELMDAIQRCVRPEGDK